jgi:hypothetical protein
MTKYKQTEFSIDLSQGNTDSLPTWMKGVSDRPPTQPKRIPVAQLRLFDLKPYAIKFAKEKTSRTDRNKQTLVPTP